MKKILLSTSLSLLFIHASAQYSFETYNSGIDTIKVIENNKTLQLPFAGGFDVPQFSQMDLDNDGKKDLVVYDREGYRLTTFLNKGAANTIKYEYAPQYIKSFPTMYDWMFLVDYNGDGKEDLFTAIPGGFRVYKNISTSNELIFQNTFPEVNCDYSTFTTRLYIAANDIPAILDVDDDGDVDILTYYQSIDSSGESIYWYKNMSMERYSKPDSMDFVIGKYCWGKFRESYTDCHINLNYPVGICGTNGRFIPNVSKEEFIRNMNARVNDGKHSGSTTTIFDANNDGKYDMLIGDVTCNNLYLVVNGTDNINPIMTQVIYNYPPNHPINIEVFPAAYILDVNNDGKKDLIATTNISNAASNTNHVQLYTNNGANDINKFDFQSDNFLLSEMIDVAEGSAPSFVDYNNDGLMDIVISNTGYWQGLGVYKPGLALYKNTGTVSLAKYELQTRDWFGFSALNIANMSPSFGDLDNDGDLDMVCGSNDGTLHYFVNNAVNNAEMSLQYVANYFTGIDVGNLSAPFIYDFDGDGKKEIIVGERTDNINLIGNTGTIANPTYTLLTDSLYKINLKSFVRYPSGRSRLTIQSLRPNEAPRVLVSNGNSRIYILGYFNSDYTQPIAGAIDSIDLYSGSFSNSNGGFFYSLADLNNDQKPELVAGNPQGGLFMFRNTSLNVGLNKEEKSLAVNIYPNPASERIYIQSQNVDKFTSVSLYNLNGQKVFNSTEENTFLAIDTKELPNGMYIIKVNGNQTVLTEKVLIIKP